MHRSANELVQHPNAIVQKLMQYHFNSCFLYPKKNQGNTSAVTKTKIIRYDTHRLVIAPCPRVFYSTNVVIDLSS